MINCTCTTTTTAHGPHREWCPVGMWERIRELEAELGKCRWHKAHEEADAEIEKLEQENERLRRRLKFRVDTVEGVPTGNGEDEIDRLEAENAALREIQKAYDADFSDLRARLERALRALRLPEAKMALRYFEERDKP